MNRLFRVVSIAAGVLGVLGGAPAEAGLNVWTSGGPPAGPNGNSIAAVAIDRLSPTTVYAGGGALNRGAFKSVNGGASWTPINNGLTLDPVNFPLSTVNGIAVHPQNSSIVYAGTFGPGVFRSSNGGASWVPANGPVNQPTELQTTSIVTLAMDPQNPNVLYVGATNGLSKSTDGGATWARKQTGLTNLFVFTIAIDPQVPSTVYAAVQTDRIFKSVNGGESWTPMNTGLPSSGGVNFGVNALAVDPQNNSIVYAGLSPGGVAKSTNGGLTWAQTDTSVLNTVVDSLAIDPTNPNVVYAGTHGSGVFRSTDGGASWAPFRDGMSFVGVPALAISPSGTCLHAATFTSGVFDLETQPGGCAPVPVAAVLPTSRAVQVSSPATAFVTIINPSSVTATGCSIALNTGVNVTFTYQTTDPATNALTGTPNTPANIGPGGFQTFVIALTPHSAFPATEVQFVFACANSAAAGVIVGVNTLLLSASDTPVPDMVALAATALNDGIVHVPGPTGAGAFAVATVNVGSAGDITVSADTFGVPLPIVLTVCQTNPVSGQCLAVPGTSVTTTVNPGETPTFAVFVVGNGVVVFDPALNRVFVRLKQGGATRGSTSVAVRTD